MQPFESSVWVATGCAVAELLICCVMMLIERQMAVTAHVRVLSYEFQQRGQQEMRRREGAHKEKKRQVKSLQALSMFDEATVLRESRIMTKSLMAAPPPPPPPWVTACTTYPSAADVEYGLLSPCLLLLACSLLLTRITQLQLSNAAFPALPVATISAAVTMVASSPAISAAGPVTVLTVIAVVVSSLAALLGSLGTLQLHREDAFTFAAQQNLLLALAVCIGAALGPIVPTSMHLCIRLSRDRAMECSAVGTCAAVLPLTAFLITASARLPRFFYSDDVVTWLPLLLSASAVMRYARALRSTRRVHPQDIAHDKRALEVTRMNASVRSQVKLKDMRAALQSEKVLKKWAFGYLFLTLEHWKDYTAMQRKKKACVATQREFLSASKLSDSDVMDLRRSTYDADLQFEQMRKGKTLHNVT